ncbi:MAG: cell division protein FtsZ, partial [bacterium]|nr:cell division protein FtsZ [bacterium]
EIKVTVIAAGFDRGRRKDTRGIASGSVTRELDAVNDLDIPSFVQG